MAEDMKRLAEEASAKLKEAREQKATSRPDLQEAYFFTRPRLSYIVDSTSRASRRRSEQSEELATGIGSEVSEDFATEVISAFFPQGTNWVESSLDESEIAGLRLEAYQVGELIKKATARDRQIFSAIRASNFDAELGTILDPHAAVGTIALWVDKPFNTRPITVKHIPPNELEFNVEEDGSVGDRFRIRHARTAKLRSILPGIKFPEKIERKIRDAKNSTSEVAWCFWRDWSDPEADLWKHVILVDGVAVHEQDLEGEGCLPLIIARMSPDASFAWGFGPSIKALQEYRVLDVITAGTQDRVDIAMNPPVTYPDDGILNFEAGIEAGKAYPARPGSGKDVKPIYFEGNPDLGFYTASDLERRIRRKHFADYPEQKGDTPPTATQWADEMVKSQRRIGTPGKKFWREGPYAIYRRFEWLLGKDGKIDPLKFEGRALTLSANNPATQAADNQKVMVAGNLLTMAKSYFPETAQAAIDELKTIEKFKGAMKDELVVLRDEQQVREMVGNILGAAQQAGVIPQG